MPTDAADALKALRGRLTACKKDLAKLATREVNVFLFTQVAVYEEVISLIDEALEEIEQ